MPQNGEQELFIHMRQNDHYSLVQMKTSKDKCISFHAKLKIIRFYCLESSEYSVQDVGKILSFKVQVCLYKF